MTKSPSNDKHVTNEQIWLAYVDFCATAIAIVAGDPDNITEQLSIDVLTSMDGVEAVASYLDVNEDRVREVVGGMLDPEWSKFYENVVFPLERADRSDSDDESARRQDYIYLMHDGNTGLYKIGRSYEPEARLDAINRSHAPGNAMVELIHVFPADDGREAERKLHEAFTGQKIEREWFGLDPEHVLSIEQTLCFRDNEFLFFEVKEKRDATNSPR